MDIQQQHIVSQYGTFFARHGLSTVIKLGGGPGKIGGVVGVFGKLEGQDWRGHTVGIPITLTEAFDFLKSLIP